MLGRLFLRTLPEEFTDNRIYAWFPLMTLAAMGEVLAELDQKDKYDFMRPESTHETCEFKEYGGTSGILGNEERLECPSLKIFKVIHGPGFFPATDTPERGEREQRQMFEALAETPDQVYDIKALVVEQSYKPVGGETSVLGIVRASSVLCQFSGLLPWLFVFDTTSSRGFRSWLRIHFPLQAAITPRSWRMTPKHPHGGGAPRNS